ncbi:hypothetical protein MRX96_053864 [Rhipicephalus microplus]
MEPVPYYYVQWHYPVFPLFPLLPPWMVPAIPYEGASNQGTPLRPGASPDVIRNGAPPRPPKRQVVKRGWSQPPAEKSTEAVRSQATRTQTRKSITPSTRETLRSNPSKEEQEEYIKLVLSRILRAVADFGLGVPTKKEEPSLAAQKFITASRCSEA